MGNLQVTPAAADATVGTDLFADHEFARVNYERILVSAGVVGAGAVAQAVLELRVGGKVIHTFRNTTTGALSMLSTDIRAIRARVPANELLGCVVRTAPTVSPILVDVAWVP